MSARVLTTADAAQWDAVLPASTSVFASLGFARVQERSGRLQARLLVAEAGTAKIAYPILLRGLPRDPGDAAARCDTTTPPYTGPLRLGDPGGEDSLRQVLDGQLGELGVVAEFAHLHPWRSVPEVLSSVAVEREVIWVDVTLDAERLRAESYAPAARKNANRAEREGVTVRAGEGPEDLAEFHRIYEATMQRRNALAAYRFDLDYFTAIQTELGEHARFALAEHEGKVIAATLYLHDDEDVHSYLGGADHGYAQLRPTNAVVHETIRWAREQGKRRLVLGAGYEPGDGIERFKATFSPLRAKLRLARHVRLPRAYASLLEGWRAEHEGHESPGAHFPEYRAP